MADALKHDWKFEYCHPHNGEYWYKCSICGASDWIANYGTVDQLDPKECKPAANKQPWSNVTREDVCIWVQDSDGSWHTACNKTWEFIDGGPADNGARFCFHCGGVLLAEPFTKNERMPT